MKKIMAALLIFGATTLVATATMAQVTLSGTLENTCTEADSIFLLEHDGIALVKLKSALLVRSGNQASFSFSFDKLEQGFYFLGVRQDNVKALILGKEASVTVQGSCASLPSAVVSSPTNAEFTAAYNLVQQYNQAFSQQINAVRSAGGNAEAVKKAEEEMAKIDANRKKLLSETTIKNPFVGNVVGLYTYLSYQNNKKQYTNEIEYFGNEYFASVNFADPQFNRIPFLYDQVRQYTQTLTQVNQPNEVQEAFSMRLLSQIPQGTRTHKCALAAIMGGYQQGNNQALFAKFGAMYLQLYGKQNPDIAAQLQPQVTQAAAFSVGGVAPDFAMAQLDGTELKLSDLRGKVVLIDFWASWCGPCRKANPEVVAIYNKYKDKGFDVLGVSLDRTKSAWETAIAADKLTWHHVSDLKGWQNAAAQLYGVQSIPQTLLIDAEGRIIAKNLKGAALEAKLKAVLEGK